MSTGEDRTMISDMGMMMGMGLVYLLIIGVSILSIDALWKYLRSKEK
ncbi:hypothetical protein J5X92_08875 [Alteromonas sp. K632G]|jgi:hypothetical protein|nr:hypothetical protein [Alteromonas sp. K632G]MBO7922325.1 hypothetical protein [Alteromonas sp. K632G]|tara:strand:+ start:7048 stop:7188 length:141 start_codon:yes stop_codon:yes gene_type:complete